MRHLKKILILCLFISSNAFALTSYQQLVKDVAYDVGQKNCVQDQCFGSTLQGIAYQESSFGTNVIGDSKGIIYYFKHNDKDIVVRKNETFTENGVRYAYYKPFNNRYIKKVYSTETWRSLEDSSLGAFQVKVGTARRVINEMKLKSYYHLLSNEKMLANKLLTDVRFGAMIAANYLKLNYKYALRKGYKHPWRFAVSMYNGGANNVRYVNKIIDRMNEIKRWR